mgnify:CR=1 FL=1
MLVVQNNKGNRHSPTILVAAITSRTGKPEMPTHIYLESEWKGVRKDSLVMLEQIRTLDRSRFQSCIGSLDAETMKKVDGAMVVSLELENYMKTYQKEKKQLEMREKQPVWIYYSIDAPEDTQGTLKKQYRELEIYAEQKGFVSVGRSSDIGGKPLWERLGFLRFMQMAKKGEPRTLLVVKRTGLFKSLADKERLQRVAKQLKLEIYSPQEGRWGDF